MSVREGGGSGGNPLLSVPFAYFITWEEDLKAMARSFTGYSFVDGQELPPSPFYYLLSGEAALVSQDITSLGTPNEPCRRVAGEFFVSPTAAAAVGFSEATKGGAGNLLVRLMRKMVEYITGTDDEDISTATGGSHGHSHGHAHAHAHDHSGRGTKGSMANRAKGTLLRQAPIDKSFHVTGIGDGIVLLLNDPQRIYRLLETSFKCDKALKEVSRIHDRVQAVPLIKQAELSSAQTAALRDMCSFRYLAPNEQARSSPPAPPRPALPRSEQALPAARRSPCFGPPPAPRPACDRRHPWPEQVFSGGDNRSEDFFFVLEGSVQISTSGHHHHHHKRHTRAERKGHLTRFGKGQYFGGAQLFLDVRVVVPDAYATERTLVCSINEANVPRFLSVRRPSLPSPPLPPPPPPPPPPILPVGRKGFT